MGGLELFKIGKKLPLCLLLLFSGERRCRAGMGLNYAVGSFKPGEKSGNEQEEVALQNASKQIVQTAILQAVQQVSQESQQKEKRVNSSVSLQLERGELTKKHEKK
ncbi:A-kinase anchor protein inhibitor 1 isoform X2 [Chrysemys picta bellii]|uniref:A-kinase anchor protein inhibitor 1 isoform X2 n=1 Tax=Chrysemys picta bellii TaxID=8478 RepID=UPI0032B28BFF